MALTKVKIDFCICFPILDLYFDAKIRKNFYTCISGQVLKVDIADVTAVLTIMAHQSSGSSGAGTGDGVDDGGDDGGDEIYYVVEVQPEFPGGQQAMLQWINNHMQYPQAALDQGIQGRVYVQFVVEKNGSLTNIKVLRNVDTSLSNEAIRLVQTMPRWTPGYKDGQPVRCQVTIPITFKID